MKRFIITLNMVLFFFGIIHSQEVYVLNLNSQITPATPALSTGIKTKGGILAASGLLAAYGQKIKTYVQFEGANASLLLPCNQVRFYIVNPQAINIASWKMSKVEKKKKNRQMLCAKTGLYSGTQTETDDIPIGITQLSKTLYLVTPTDPLTPGEYALYRIQNGTPVNIYDFRTEQIQVNLTEPSNKNVIAAISKLSDTSVSAGQNSFAQSSNNANQVAPAMSYNNTPPPSQPQSDVDTRIPKTDKVDDQTFALIISNENYKQVEPVPFAINDGEIFKSYLHTTFGVPERNIFHVKDATLGEINHAIDRMKEIADVIDDPIRIIMHYSGHGIPDESTSEGYILPIDNYGTDVKNALKISDLYKTLSTIKTESTILFLDACFSGAQRSGKMIASARGVAIKAKGDKPEGNIVAFAAAQNDQTAYPYTEKQHGLMTYFILKKFQETKGKVNLGDLSDYVIKNVKREAILTNSKKQEPVVLVSDTYSNWRKIPMKM